MKIELKAPKETKQMQYFKCDNCGEMFSLNLKEVNLPKGGKYSRKRYFVCSCCKAEYIVALWDKKGEIVKE